MPVMNFDLEDGKAPITIRLDANDGERFMAFLDDCQKRRPRNESVGDCAECERHIQEVDASRDRITQLEAALALASRELRNVLTSINAEKMPFDGDSFHEALAAIDSVGVK